MSKALVQELVARLVPLIDRDTCITVFEFVNEMYRQSEGYIEASIDGAIAWFRPGCNILHDRSSELPEWDDRETWEAVREFLGDFPVVRTTHYLGTLGAIGWEAAEALGITEWLGYAREYPASPSGSGGPLGWDDPIGGVWERPGLDAQVRPLQRRRAGDHARGSARLLPLDGHDHGDAPPGLVSGGGSELPG